MNSLTYYASLIGSEKMWSVNSVLVPVVVKDIKIVFGRADVLVAPVGGQGQVWVSENALKSN